MDEVWSFGVLEFGEFGVWSLEFGVWSWFATSSLRHLGARAEGCCPSEGTALAVRGWELTVDIYDVRACLKETGKEKNVVNRASQLLRGNFETFDFSDLFVLRLVFFVEGLGGRTCT